MAELVVGPILRHVGEEDATVWVETDARCEVEVLGQTEPTFCVDGHHYALVCIEGLEPGSRSSTKCAWTASGGGRRRTPSFLQARSAPWTLAARCASPSVPVGSPCRWNRHTCCRRTSTRTAPRSTPFTCTRTS